jgi:hypothetical protein
VYEDTIMPLQPKCRYLLLDQAACIVELNCGSSIGQGAHPTPLNFSRPERRYRPNRALTLFKNGGHGRCVHDSHCGGPPTFSVQVRPRAANDTGGYIGSIFDRSRRRTGMNRPRSIPALRRKKFTIAVPLSVPLEGKIGKAIA